MANNKQKLLSEILADSFKKYLDLENRSIGTLINFDRISDAIPIPSVNGADNIEKNLTDANKEYLLKIVDECYRTDNYGKLMDFLTYAFPITYSNKDETVTIMYNALRKDAHKSEMYELTYEDMRKIFETGKPLEKLKYDASTLSRQFNKKGKQLLSKEDKIRFLIQGSKVAKFYEEHTNEMDHFRALQDQFYHREKNGVSNVNVDMLNELHEAGFDVILMRQMFYKGGSKEEETYKLLTSDVRKPSSALDSIEMRDVVEADSVIRSIFLGKYVKEILADKNATLSFYNLSKEDQDKYASFMSLEGEDINSILNDDVEMYASCIKSLVNKLFKNKYEIVTLKPHLSVAGEDGWVAEAYSDGELRAHKKTVLNAVVQSAIKNGAFTTTSKEEFLNKLAIACTDDIVTKHFNHLAMAGISVDENGEAKDFVSDFPDSANEPYAGQNRKCACATINYDGKLYFVDNVPAIVSGERASNVADDEWQVSITDQELNALIVKLSNAYGVSFSNLRREDIIVGKNMAAVEASRMATGKVRIETAFEIAKKHPMQKESNNPYIHEEDTVKNYSTFRDSEWFQHAYNREREQYVKVDSIAELATNLLPKVLEALQGNFMHIYSDRKASIENTVKESEEKRAETLEAKAMEEQAKYDSEEHPTSDKPFSSHTETLSHEEINTVSSVGADKEVIDVPAEIVVEKKSDKKKTVTKKPPVARKKSEKPSGVVFSEDLTIKPPPELREMEVPDPVEGLAVSDIEKVPELRVSDGRPVYGDEVASAKQEHKKENPVSERTNEEIKNKESHFVEVHKLRNATSVSIDGQTYFIVKGIIYDENCRESIKGAEEKKLRAILAESSDKIGDIFTANDAKKSTAKKNDTTKAVEEIKFSASINTSDSVKQESVMPSDKDGKQKTYWLSDKDNEIITF